MATQALAPEKSVAKKVKRTEPQTYIYRLTDKFPELFKGSSPYPARLDIPTSDTILWPYVDGKPLSFDDAFEKTDGRYDYDFLPRGIRYVAGANTIFLDEQEKTEAYKRDMNGKNTLLDNDANKMHLTFQNAEIRVPAYNKVLRNYLWCNNQCRNQFEKANDNGNRFKQLNTRYELLDFAGKDQNSVSTGILRAKAYDLAKSTGRQEILFPHAKYLGIPFVHGESGEPRDFDAIKEDYIDFAYKNPKLFLDSYSDPKIKIIYKISELLDKNEITLLKSPGQAHFVSSGSFIAQIPDGQSPVEFLASFALTKAGEEFSNNLRAY